MFLFTMITVYKYRLLIGHTFRNGHSTVDIHAPKGQQYLVTKLCTTKRTRTDYSIWACRVVVNELKCN